jgi:hypothetical protein
VKRFEDLLVGRGRQARTGIAHGDQHATRFGFPGTDQQFSWAVANTAQGLDGIDDQVQQDLLQLHSIALNEG